MRVFELPNTCTRATVIAAHRQACSRLSLAACLDGASRFVARASCALIMPSASLLARTEAYSTYKMHWRGVKRNYWQHTVSLAWRGGKRSRRMLASTAAVCVCASAVRCLFLFSNSSVLTTTTARCSAPSSSFVATHASLADASSAFHSSLPRPLLLCSSTSSPHQSGVPLFRSCLCARHSASSDPWPLCALSQLVDGVRLRTLLSPPSLVIRRQPPLSYAVVCVR